MDTQSLADYIQRKYGKTISTTNSNSNSRIVITEDKLLKKPRTQVDFSRNNIPNGYDAMESKAINSQQSFRERVVYYLQDRQINLKRILDSLDEQLQSIEDDYRVEFKNPAVLKLMHVSKKEYKNALEKWSRGLRVEGNNHADRSVIMKIDGVLNAYRRVVQWYLTRAREAVEKTGRWSLPGELLVLFDRALEKYNQGYEQQEKGYADSAKYYYQEAISISKNTINRANKY